MIFKRKVLKNGMRIILAPMKSNPTVTVLVLVEAGSKYENKENNGISHFLEHMAFKGTTKRPHYSMISKELDALGTQYNAFTSHEYTGYWIKADAKKFENILEIVSDIYINSILPEEEIEKEKGVIIEEINMRSDTPQTKVWEEFFKLLYGDTPTGWLLTGPKENIEKMKREDFIDYRNKHYVASGTVVIVAGKINPRSILPKIEKAFKNIGKWKKSGKEKVIENQKKPAIKLFFKDTDQSHLILGFRTYSTYNKHNPIIRIIDAILSGGQSSRLFMKLRDEMGICYYIDSSNDTFTDHGVFGISAGVDQKRIKEAIKAILEEIKIIKTEIVSEEELDKVKQYLIGNIKLGLESSDSIASFLGGQEILRKDIKTSEDRIKEIQAVKAEDIKFVAEKIFKEESMNLAVLGKFKDEKEFLDILKV